MRVEFKGSFPSIDTLPKQDLPEFAFIGRSNVGKSSLINMICDHKDLAKTSSKPGKTQHIVRFSVDEKWFLVDLPGYGYAKVSKESREKFGKLIQDYILERESLFCLFVLIDSRLEPQKIDLEFMEWLGVSGVPFCITFTKTDKLKTSELESNIEKYKEKLLETWEFLPDIFITSAEKKIGKEDVLKFIINVLKNNK